MTPTKFFTTTNRKKVAAYLIEKGNHVATVREIEEQTGVMYRTIRDILTRAEAKGFLLKDKLDQKEGMGIKIELLSPMMSEIEPLRLACKDVLSKPTSIFNQAADDLAQLSDSDYERSWPNLHEAGWNSKWTKALVHRLLNRDIPVGGIKTSFEHIEYILLNNPPRKSKDEVLSGNDLLMHIFRSLDDKGYIAIPPGYIPADVALIIGKD